MQNLTLDDAFARFVPHFIVIHTCVIAYVSSPLSTAAQKAPPVPLDPDAMRAMVPVIDRIRVKLLQGRPSNYLWSGQVEMNLAVFMYAGVAADVLKVCPLLLTAEMGPAGSDFLACRGLGIPAGAGVPVDLNRLIIDEADTLECFVRDPKKMKACSRVSRPVSAHPALNSGPFADLNALNPPDSVQGRLLLLRWYVSFRSILQLFVLLNVARPRDSPLTRCPLSLRRPTPDLQSTRSMTGRSACTSPCARRSFGQTCDPQPTSDASRPCVLSHDSTLSPCCCRIDGC